jgi:hypothetical protein
MWLLQLSNLERVYTVQPNVDRNKVNSSSDSLMENISDTKCIQDLSQEAAEIKEVLGTEPSTAEDYEGDLAAVTITWDNLDTFLLVSCG